MDKQRESSREGKKEREIMNKNKQKNREKVVMKDLLFACGTDMVMRMSD